MSEQDGQDNVHLLMQSKCRFQRREDGTDFKLLQRLPLRAFPPPIISRGRKGHADSFNHPILAVFRLQCCVSSHLG
uniref:Uncharacterized protein n=1 Tax=Anguilla anguilla TaxID=7936 RepID=A0A0E9QU72_ANGAN